MKTFCLPPKDDWSLSAAVAGLISLIVTYTGPVLIVVQAAKAGTLTPAQLSSWIWAITLGAGVLGLWFSLRHRIPVIGAWSTPGVVLLISGLAQYSYAEVVGCYLAVAVAVTLLGYSGLFEKLMSWLPQSILSAMIAGILLPICIRMLAALHADPMTILPIVLMYFLGRRFWPRYAVASALLAGIASLAPLLVSAASPLQLTLATPVLTWPAFSVNALLGLGLPLLLLALTQYATGVAVLRQAGYATPSSPLVGFSGLLSIPLSFFGSSGINPAAIVGALCAGTECHPQAAKRYTAGIVCGLGYLALGALGASVISLFALLPTAIVTTLVGLALMGTMASSLAAAVASEPEREPALVTFLITASGLSWLGYGAALTGMLAGMAVWAVMVGFRQRAQRRQHRQRPLVTAGDAAIGNASSIAIEPASNTITSAATGASTVARR